MSTFQSPDKAFVFCYLLSIKWLISRKGLICPIYFHYFYIILYVIQHKAHCHKTKASGFVTDYRYGSLDFNLQALKFIFDVSSMKIYLWGVYWFQFVLSTNLFIAFLIYFIVVWLYKQNIWINYDRCVFNFFITSLPCWFYLIL